LSFDQTWQSSTKAALLVSSEASAKSPPRRAPGTATLDLSCSYAAPTTRLGCLTFEGQGDTLAPVCVTSANDFVEEGAIGLQIGEVSCATQQQGIQKRLFQVTMGAFD
jgi:hypothetical protein